jgi:hypothetical protein
MNKRVLLVIVIAIILILTGIVYYNYEYRDCDDFYKFVYNFQTGEIDGKVEFYLPVFVDYYGTDLPINHDFAINGDQVQSEIIDTEYGKALKITGYNITNVEFDKEYNKRPGYVENSVKISMDKELDNGYGYGYWLYYNNSHSNKSIVIDFEFEIYTGDKFRYEGNCLWAGKIITFNTTSEISIDWNFVKGEYEEGQKN